MKATRTRTRTCSGLRSLSVAVAEVTLCLAPAPSPLPWLWLLDMAVSWRRPSLWWPVVRGIGGEEAHRVSSPTPTPFLAALPSRSKAEKSSFLALQPPLLCMKRGPSAGTARFRSFAQRSFSKLLDTSLRRLDSFASHHSQERESSTHPPVSNDASHLYLEGVPCRFKRSALSADAPRSLRSRRSSNDALALAASRSISSSGRASQTQRTRGSLGRDCTMYAPQST